jgi:cellulose synthase/poly-beta-1,6-N-acetylglucosamine synthase-like glycosyltransferase
VGKTVGASDDILVFTDANTEFTSGSVKALVDAFDDPCVGGVCGRLVFTNAGEASGLNGATSVGAGGEETGYWDWENRMKRGESRLDSCLGANGAIYAVRRDLFWSAIPANTIVDDFVIGMKVREQGRRMAYVEGAVARESLPPSTRDEWRRRVRIGAGAFQALVLCRRCLLPRYGLFAWMFWSHKVLRWFTPHLLLLLVVLTCWAIAARIAEGTGLSVGLFIGGGVWALLVAAPVGMLVSNRRGKVVGVLRLAWYFVQIQAAMLVGSLRFFRGGLSGAWERTRR